MPVSFFLLLSQRLLLSDSSMLINCLLVFCLMAVALREYCGSCVCVCVHVGWSPSFREFCVYLFEHYYEYTVSMKFINLHLYILACISCTIRLYIYCRCLCLYVCICISVYHVCRCDKAGREGGKGGFPHTSLSVEGLRVGAQPVSGRLCWLWRCGVMMEGVRVVMEEHSDASSWRSCSVSPSSRDALLACRDTVSVRMQVCRPPRDGLICFKSSQYSSSLDRRHTPSTMRIFSLV